MKRLPELMKWSPKGKYSQTPEIFRHKKYLWNVIVLQEKSQLGMRKLTTSKNVY